MIKVTIIEDDLMVQDINKKFLDRISGYKLHKVYKTIEEAKEDLLINQPDLILLDVFLPDGKGVDLLKWIRINDIDTDVIMITADNSSQTFNESSRYGVVDYLVKPFNYERFESAMFTYLENSKQIKKNKELNQIMIDKINHQNNDNVFIQSDYESIISNQTYTKILDFLKSNTDESYTAVEISKILGISRITARRYLDYLEKHNILLIELEYGKVGRPKNKYRINKL